MTTAEIVKFVEAFGSRKKACSEALLKKLLANEVTMEQLEEAIGYGSAAYPCGYPHKDMTVVDPSFLAVLSVKLARANGDTSAFAL